jgi:hypothetical protein
MGTPAEHRRRFSAILRKALHPPGLGVNFRCESPLVDEKSTSTSSISADRFT